MILPELVCWSVSRTLKRLQMNFSEILVRLGFMTRSGQLDFGCDLRSNPGIFTSLIVWQDRRLICIVLYSLPDFTHFNVAYLPTLVCLMPRLRLVYCRCSLLLVRHKRSLNMVYICYLWLFLFFVHLCCSCCNVVLAIVIETGLESQCSLQCLIVYCIH